MGVYSDQTRLFDPEKFASRITMIGLGGIGNSVVPLLAKMGVRDFVVYDPDIFEARNGPTEIFYPESAVGEPKVQVMLQTLKFLFDTEFCYNEDDVLPADAIGYVAHQERVDANTELSGIVISGVDSMNSRQEIWKAVKEHCYDIDYFVDARSAGEVVQIFAVCPYDDKDVQNYETWLFDDSEASPLECGARNIGYISAYIAAEVARIISLFARDETDSIEFLTNHDFGGRK